MKKLLYVLLMLFVVPFVLGANNPYLGSAIAGSNLDVYLISQDPNPVEPGDYVELRFRAENFGSMKMEDVSFEIIPEYPFSLDESESAVKNVGQIDPRQKDEDAVILLWKLRVDENAVEGTNEIELKYFVQGEEKVKLDEFEVEVKGFQSILAVESINVLPENKVPGQPATTIITLKNVADSVIKNIKVKLDIDDTDFAVVGSSAEKIIRSINSQETEQVSFDIISAAATESKTHSIPLEIEYMDEDGTAFSISSSFGIKIYDPPSYILTLDESTVKTPGSNGNIVVSISNIGQSDINFLTVELLESDQYEILSPTSVMYLGNLESDDFETADYTIHVKGESVGDIPLKLKLNYKDSYNKIFSEEQEVTLHVYPKQEAMAYGLVPKPNFTTTIIFVLIIGAIVFYFVRRNIKRKKALQKKR